MRDIHDGKRLALCCMTTVPMRVYTILGSTPGVLAFHRDVLLNVPLVVDCKAITQSCEQKINEKLRYENLKRRSYGKKQCQEVLKQVYTPTKLGLQSFGISVMKHVYVS